MVNPRPAKIKEQGPITNTSLSGEGLKNVSKPFWKASKIKRLSETPDRCLTV